MLGMAILASPCVFDRAYLAPRHYVWPLYGPSVGVVYTWVNGSDPRWLAKKRHYERCGTFGQIILSPFAYTWHQVIR
jgi:hypothetical protein